jgi:outer membrane protein TolC
MGKKSTIVCIILMLVFSNASVAQQTLMDAVDNTLLDSLVSYAKKTYPRIKFFEARTNASKANLNKQKLGWFESLTFSYVVQPKDNVSGGPATNPVFLNGYQFGLFLNVGAILQRPAIIKQAKEEVRTYEQEALEYDQILTAEVKKRYYAYLQQAIMLRLVSKTVLDGQALLENVKVRYEKSELPFDEYSKVAVSTNGNIQTKLETEANLLTAISAIEEMIGTGFIEFKKKYGTK